MKLLKLKFVSLKYIVYNSGEKKIKKLIKPRKLEKKNNRKNRTVEKNRLNRLKF
jgi:transcriptional regulatory protein LevR